MIKRNTYYSPSIIEVDDLKGLAGTEDFDMEAAKQLLECWDKIQILSDRVDMLTAALIRATDGEPLNIEELTKTQRG